jgi:hypothetical protein
MFVFTDAFVYKCVGHMYKSDKRKAVSYYLILNASNAFNVETGDVVVSNQSHGFLSTITNINPTSEFIFVETSLLRCDNHTVFNSK